MLKKFINPILLLHLALCIASQKATFSSTNNNIEWSQIDEVLEEKEDQIYICLLYTSPSPRDGLLSRMPSSA